MSTLTIRQSTDADIPLLLDLGIDERAIRSANFCGLLCYEKGKLVGLTIGRGNATAQVSSKIPSLPAYQDLIKSFIVGRWDIYFALMERHADIAMRMGHKLALARVPVDGQCTNVAPSPVLMNELTAKVGLHWTAEGYDTAKAAVAAWRTEPVVLAELLPRVKAELDRLGCKRVWGY